MIKLKILFYKLGMIIGFLFLGYCKPVNYDFGYFQDPFTLEMFKMDENGEIHKRIINFPEEGVPWSY